MQNNTFFEDSYPNNIIVFEELSSTNDYLKELLSKVKPLEPYTVIMAKNQTAGKGQRGNVWTTAPHQNLTASFFLSPNILPINKQFLITIVSSLAVYDVIEHFCPSKTFIKWPNDIMIKNKKIAGILIENRITQNHIKHSIVGIGINVLQQNFPTTINHKATSLRIETNNLNIDILNLAKHTQQRLKYYMERILWDESNLVQLYNDRLFYKNIQKQYYFNNQEVTGEIIKVDLDGLLQIVIENKLHKIDLKGISYIL